MTYKFGEITTLSYARETALRARLKSLLENMELGDRAISIEYGDPNQKPGSWMSYIRITRMNTFGVMQFRICELSHGTEGGGAYHPSVSSALEWAMQMVRHYHRPSPLRERLTQMGRKFPELDWFSFDKDVEKALPLRGMLNARRDLGEGAVTVDLK